MRFYVPKKRGEMQKNVLKDYVSFQNKPQAKLMLSIISEQR